LSTRGRKRRHEELVQRAHTNIQSISKHDASSPDTIVQDIINIFSSFYPRIYKIITSNDTDLTLAANITQLMLDMPQHAHLKKPLLTYLARNINVKELATKFNVSVPSIKAALSSKYDSSTTDLFSKYPHSVTRDKIGDMERELIKQFIICTCPTKSGSARTRYTQYDTNKQLYQEYMDALEVLVEQIGEQLCNNQDHNTRTTSKMWKDNMKRHYHNRKIKKIKHELILMTTTYIQSPFHKLATASANNNYVQLIDLIMSYIGAVKHLSARPADTFARLKAELPIRRIKSHSGQYDCDICVSVPKVERELKLNPNDSLLQAQHREIVNHSYIRTYQQVKYATLRANLRPGEVLVAQDFGTLDMQPNVSIRGKIIEYVTNLVLVLEYVDSQGKYHRKYVDVLCDDNESRGADYHYVRAAWSYLLEQTDIFQPFSTIMIWSDGASQQFKQVYTQYFFSRLFTKYHKHVTYSFWASYHGHGLHDSHIGHNKTVIRQYLTQVQGKRQLAYDKTTCVYSSTIATTPIQSLQDLKTILLSTYHAPKPTKKSPKPSKKKLRTSSSSSPPKPVPYVSYDVFVFDSIDRSPTLKPNLKTLSQGTQKYHFFRYDETFGSNIVYTSIVSYSNAPEHAPVLQRFKLKSQSTNACVT
jgi:hypothetical protein